MHNRVDSMAHGAACTPEVADLVAKLIEEGNPSALPILLAPDLVRLLHDIDTPGEVACAVLEFMQGLQIIAQIRCEDLEDRLA